MYLPRDKATWQHTQCPISAPPWLPWLFMYSCHLTLLSIIPWLSPEFGSLLPLHYSPQYSGLENSKDCTVHGVTKSGTWRSNFHSEKFLSAISANKGCCVKPSHYKSTLRRFRMRSTRCWLQVAEAFSKRMISVSPVICILHTQKSAKLINLRCLVFFNSNLSMFWLPGLCCKNSYIT